MPISCPPIIFKSRRGGRIDGRHRIQTSAMHRMQSSAMMAELMAGDYYSLNDIAILTKETQNGES